MSERQDQMHPLIRKLLDAIGYLFAMIVLSAVSVGLYLALWSAFWALPWLFSGLVVLIPLFAWLLRLLHRSYPLSLKRARLLRNALLGVSIFASFITIWNLDPIRNRLAEQYVPGYQVRYVEQTTTGAPEIVPVISTDHWALTLLVHALSYIIFALLCLSVYLTYRFVFAIVEESERALAGST